MLCAIHYSCVCVTITTIATIIIVSSFIILSALLHFGSSCVACVPAAQPRADIFVLHVMGVFAVISATVACAGADSRSIISALIFTACLLGHLRDTWPTTLKRENEEVVVVTLGSGIEIRVST